MKSIFFAIRTLGVAVLGLGLLGCGGLFVPATGSVSLQLGTKDLRTLNPNINLVPEVFDLQAVGPGGESRSLTGISAGTALTLDGLSVGEWTISVQAFSVANNPQNIQGTPSGASVTRALTGTLDPVGEGSVTLQVSSGTQVAVINLSSPAGLGYHQAYVEVDGPSLGLTLSVTVDAFSPQLLTLSNAGNYEYVNLAPITLDSGYHTVKYVLSQSGVDKWSDVTVVRILPGIATMTYLILNHDGSGKVTGLFDSVDTVTVPLSVTPTVTSQSQPGSAISVSTQVGPNGGLGRGPFTWDWYLNGQLLAAHSATLNLATTPNPPFNLSVVVKGPNYQASNSVAFFSVTYDGNGASSGVIPNAELHNTTENGFTLANNVGNLAQAGKVFASWNTMIDGTGSDFAPGAQMNTGPVNLVLYAIYRSQYQLSFDFNGGTGTALAPQTFLQGALTTLPLPTVYKPGFTFGGWNTMPDGTGNQYPAATLVNLNESANTVLYVKWIPDPVASFNLNGGTGTTPGSVSVGSGTYITMPNPPAATNGGMLFLRWNTQPDGSGIPLEPNASWQVNSDVVFYAMWATPDTIIFDPNGAGGASPGTTQVAHLAQYYVLPGPNTMTMAGYTFMGWNTMMDGTGEHFDSNTQFIPVATSMTLYAEWWAIDPTYSITYTNGDTFAGQTSAIYKNPYGRNFFKYDYFESTSGNGVGLQTWVVTKTLTAASQLLPCIVTWKGNHAYAGAMGNLSLISGPSALTTLVASSTGMSGGFNFSPSLIDEPLAAGQTFGFKVEAGNGDSNSWVGGLVSWTSKN